MRNKFVDYFLCCLYFEDFYENFDWISWFNVSRNCSYCWQRPSVFFFNFLRKKICYFLKQLRKTRDIFIHMSIFSFPLRSIDTLKINKNTITWMVVNLWVIKKAELDDASERMKYFYFCLLLSMNVCSIIEQLFIWPRKTKKNDKMYKLVKMYRSERKTEEFGGFEHKFKGWNKMLNCVFD